MLTTLMVDVVNKANMLALRAALLQRASPRRDRQQFVVLANCAIVRVDELRVASRAPTKSGAPLSQRCAMCRKRVDVSLRATADRENEKRLRCACRLLRDDAPSRVSAVRRHNAHCPLQIHRALFHRLDRRVFQTHNEKQLRRQTQLHLQEQQQRTEIKYIKSTKTKNQTKSNISRKITMKTIKN